MAQPINFGSSQKSGLDPLAGAGELSMNVYTDKVGVVRRRPGISALGDAPSTAVAAGGVSGLFSTGDNRLLVVGDGAERNIFEVSGGAVRQLAVPVGGTGRPQFAQTEMLVAIAGGSAPVKYLRVERDTSLLGGNPPKASHILGANLRLVANDVQLDRTKARFSDIAQGTLSYAGLETWDPTTPPTAGYFTAEARPDPVVGIGENTSEIFVWGSESLQIFTPDPTFIFAPTTTIPYGLGAPYSVVKADQHFFWFDQYRRFIMSDGRSREDISEGIAKTLEQIDVVDDCFGYRVVTDNLDAVVWTFPTDGRTFAFQKGSGWAQWSGFNKNWTRFKVNAHCYRISDGLNVVGTTDGFLGKFDHSVSSDLGETINAYTVTGYEDRGTDMRKHCQVVRLALRRGTVSGSTAPVGFLGWRDRPGPWEAKIPVSFGASNDTEIVVELRSLGVYRRRQWMFEFSGTEELSLVRASEEFEVADQ